MSYYTFLETGSLPTLFSHAGRYSMLSIGREEADTLGSSLKIKLVTEDGGRHVLREVASFDELTNRSLKLELPTGSSIDIEYIGSGPLYVEHRNLGE